MATLIAIVVVGAFDAVLLLPAPTFFAWTAIGALATSAKPIGEMALTPTTRRRLMLAAAVVGGLLILHSASQVTAMALAGKGDRAALARAARVDPGSYRIRMLLARAWVAAGRCDRARPYAEQASALLPRHPAPRAILKRCGKTR